MRALGTSVSLRQAPSGHYLVSLIEFPQTAEAMASYYMSEEYRIDQLLASIDAEIGAFAVASDDGDYEFIVDYDVPTSPTDSSPPSVPSPSAKEDQPVPELGTRRRTRSTSPPI